MSAFIPPFSPAPENRHWSHAITGVLEIGLVMGASIFAASQANALIQPGLAEALGLFDGSAPDFYAASLALGLQLSAQYAVLFALVALIGWMRGRRSLKSYALVRPKAGPGNPLTYGLVLGLLVSVVISIVFILQDIAPIGADTPIWAVTRDVPWDGGYWLFLAVGSFAFVPLIEEGAWRSYILGRLGEGFAPGAALLVTTALFSLMHYQYLRADAAMMLTLFGLIIATIGFGFATLRTGSLLPALIAHTVINFPLSTEFQFARIALAVLALIVWRKTIWAEIGVLFGLLAQRSSWLVLPALLAIGGIVAALMLLPQYAPYIGGALLALFLATGFLRRSAWREAR